MVLAFDYLDSMAWTVAVSGVLIAVLALRLPKKNPSNPSVETGGDFRKGLAAAIGVCGAYLFLTGLAISLTWPFAMSGGAYNVLFGGVATLGGLLLLATSATLFLNANLAAVSYFALVAGLYAAVDAFAMVNYGLTKDPMLSALGYLSFSATAVLSVPATHTENKALRWIFAIFAILFAIAWGYQAANFTWSHLKPP